MTRVLTTNGSQPHRLRQRLQEAGVQHGQQVTGEIEVRVEGAEKAKAYAATVYFCDMPALKDFQIIGEPDNEDLPHYAVLNGLDVDRDGYWNVPVTIHLNGAMNVTVTGQPEFVDHDGREYAVDDGEWPAGNSQRLRDAALVMEPAC